MNHTDDLVPLATPHEDAGATRYTGLSDVRPGGWRRALAVVSGERLRLASSRDRWLAAQAAIVRHPITRPHVVAFLSLKGGVGKTTVCAAVGHLFARARGDLVVALDANPDSGSLVGRVAQESNRTVIDLLACASSIRDYAELRAFTSRAASGLQAVAVSLDPLVAVFLGAIAYPRVIDLLSAHYRLILVDLGPGLLSGAADGVVQVADQLVIVASEAEDAADVSYRTVHWLMRMGRDAQARNAVAVINAVDDELKAGTVEAGFREHCRAVVRVPRDPHLRLGSRIELAALRRRTRESFVRLAATLAEHFA